MNIVEVQQHYIAILDSEKETVKTCDRQLRSVSMLRLLVMALTVFLVYLLWGRGAAAPVLAGIAGLAVFLALVKIHDRIARKKEFSLKSIDVAGDELRATNYDFSPFYNGSEYIDPGHYFSLDLDLFGDRSLFQSINRTVTVRGKEILSGWFREPLTDKEKIIRRQEAVAELAGDPAVISRFRTTGLLNSDTPADVESLRRFASSPYTFLQKKRMWEVIIYAYPILWTVFIILFVFNILPLSLLPLLVMLFFAFSQSRNRAVSRFQESVEKKAAILRTYSRLIGMIENSHPVSEELQGICSELRGENRKVSAVISSFSRLTANLELRDNALGRLLLSTTLLWDIRCVLKIEQWKYSYGNQLLHWLEAVGHYDALISLANYSYNNPGYIFPSVADSFFRLEATGMGHPLLHRDVCVCNDICIPSSAYFMIITGANMAGKSTYLRTAGVNYLLACIGAPVFARSFSFYPAGMITSLRTSDSLNDNESYFFAELKRLNVIIEELRHGREVFIILDEILKGTNSEDKRKGSFALVEQLVRMNGSGMIATHDLALSDLGAKLPGSIRNYCFESEITGGHLTFSYTKQEGVAKNMNACFLMKKMGIIME